MSNFLYKIENYLLLRFIHFSDIHFRSPQCNAPGADPDICIRDLVLLDIRDQIALDGKAIDGILITGDIAFAGKKDEYFAAKAWLDEISSEFNIAPENIYVVPGNHDVDRGLSDSYLIRTVREGIEIKSSKKERETAIEQALNDSSVSEAIFSPMQNYIDFSSLYQCEISAKQSFWSKNLSLSENVEVNIKGITTTLFSNKNDRKGNLLLGSNQFYFRRKPGILNISLMHHPCDWLEDGDDLTDLLSNNVHVQLFGHKHRARWDVSDNTFRISAISLHPEREEAGYEPGYNIIDIQDKPYGVYQSKIEVKVVVRKLESNPNIFTSKLFSGGKQYITQNIMLDINPKKNSAVREPKLITTPSEPQPIHLVEVVDKKNTVEVLDLRNASRVFGTLLRSDRDNILIKCGLLSVHELVKSDLEKQKIGFRRAQAIGKEEMLCEMIQIKGRKDV